MDYFDALKALTKEAENTPKGVIEAELQKDLEPEVKKRYDGNFKELLYGDDLCDYLGIDYYDVSAENVNRISYLALLAARNGVCIEKNLEPATLSGLIRYFFLGRG